MSSSGKLGSSDYVDSRSHICRILSMQKPTIVAVEQIDPISSMR